MKYLSQINVIVMLLGCIVVLYAFSVTFWEAVPQEPFEIERFPGTQSEAPAGGISSEIPVVRHTVTTETSATEELTPTPSQGQVAPSLSDIVSSGKRRVGRGTPSRTSARSRAGRSSRVEARRPGLSNTADTERSRAEDASGVVPGPQQRLPTWKGISGPTETQGFETPPVDESQKRESSDQPPLPPVRSSLMGRTPPPE